MNSIDTDVTTRVTNALLENLAWKGILDVRCRNGVVRLEGIATSIYNMTAVFLTPFFGLTATPTANGSILEIPSLIAMLVYALLAWGIVRVLWITFEKPLIQ